MSSFLSSAYSDTEIQSQVNTPLVLKALSVIQGRYDTNKAQVEQTLAVYKNNLKGLRDVDNEYIAASLKQVEGVINGYGNKDYSITATKDTLLGNLKSVTEDPIIRSAVLNRAKFDQANAEVAEKKKKNDGSYSDRNYQDMLDQGGFNAYMKGETKDLGNLSYTDYVDVATTQDKKAADYAKERGLKDQFLGRTSDAYETTDKYGVKVTREEIERYLTSTLDEKTKAQLSIDARQSLGKLDEKSFTTFMESSQRQDNEDLRASIAQVKAERDTVSDDKKPQYDTYLKDAEKKLDEGELKLKNGTYDKSGIYEVYTKNKIRDIASNHDVDIITKIDTSDMPFEIMKFETETQLKMKELELKDKANKIAEGGTLGTMTETPQPIEEKQSTKLQETQQATYKADQALDAYLKENNAEYKKMTPQQQWNYKLKLNPNNPLGKGNTTALKNLVNTFQEAQGGYSKIVKEANKKITTDAEISYNNLIGAADLNLDNLSTTMPLTASLLKSKKNFGSLSNEEKLGITTEFASNYLQYGGDLNDDVRTVYEKVVISNKATIKNYGTTKSKQVGALLVPATTEDVGGYWSNLGSRVAGAANVVLGVPLHMIGKGATYGWNSLFNGQRTADREYSEWDKAEQDMLRYRDESVKNYAKFSKDYFGGEDTNITELEGRDTKDDKDILGRFNTTADKVKGDIDRIAGSYQENRKTGQAFTFSTEDKSQAPIAIALRAAVLNSEEKPSIPAGTNDYTVAREGTGYRISFISGSGEKASYSSAYVAKLPPNVAGMYEQSVQSWTNNPNNPNIKLEPIPIDAYVSPSRRNQDIKNLIGNRDLPAEVKNMLMTNPAQTAFATNSELKESIQKKYGDSFYKKNAESIDNILNNKYIAIPYVSGGNFFMKIQYTEDGEEKEYNESQPLGTEKDDHGFYLAYMETILKLKSEKINKLYIAE